MNPYDHFWIVGAATGAAYSSRLNSYVSVDGPEVFAFTEAGGVVGTILNEAELWQVMQQRAAGHFPDWLFDGATFAQPAAGSYNEGQLQRYAALKRYEREVGGAAFAGTTVATDRESQAMISGAYNLVQRKPSAVVRFKTDGGFVTMDAQAIEALADVVGEHVQNCFAKEAEAHDAIEAGTATTLAAVDAIIAG